MLRAEDAIGKWHGIYESLGIKVGDGRHIVCPICGKNNFRMDDRHGKGSYICTCGSGDGWKLLQTILGCDFIDALKQVEGIIGTVTPSCKCKEKAANPKVLREMFVSSKPATEFCPVGRYLLARGLKTIPKILRTHLKCYESETKTDQIAMLAVVTMPDNQAVTIHRTYLGNDGKKLKGIESQKKIMPGLKKITGGAIRLFDPEHGVIGVAEGIETAIACYEIHGIPTWSTMNASGMASFIPPMGIKKVYIFGDNDSHKTFAGQAAAYGLAKRLLEVHKMPVDVMIPDGPGDWLDEKNNRD